MKIEDWRMLRDHRISLHDMSDDDFVYVSLEMVEVLKQQMEEVLQSAYSVSGDPFISPENIASTIMSFRAWIGKNLQDSH